MQKDWIIRGGRTMVAIAAGLIVFGGTASAIVLTEKTEEQKLRTDINGQQTKYVACLVKAATNCEKGAGSIAQQCFLATSTFSPPADAKGKFAADVLKCDSKLAYLKKAKTLTALTGYEAIGCPGDSVTGGSDQRYADMTGYQAGALASTKGQIDALAFILGSPGITGCDAITDPDPVKQAKAQEKCQTTEVGRIAGYAGAVQKCMLACENDYKNKKGNGGPTDVPSCRLAANGQAGAGDVNFNACVTKAHDKAIKKAPWPASVAALVLPALSSALSDAADDLYNENDC